MKLLKYTLFHNCQRAPTPFLDLCHFSILNISTSYAAVLGIIGVVLSGVDIYTIITTGHLAKLSLLKGSNMKSATDCLTPNICRDLKLIGLVLSLEYYLLLIVGTILRNGTFFLPWMIFYSIIIALEFVLFLIRTFSRGLVLNKHSLILSIFVVYNWLAIFCAFMHITGECR